MATYAENMFCAGTLGWVAGLISTVIWLQGSDNPSITLPCPATNRLIQVQVQSATNAYCVKLSDTPDFHEGANGIQIKLLNLDSNLNFVDLDILYPGGLPGGHGIPAVLPENRKELRLLVVPTRMTDGGEPPDYVTTEWMARLLFGENAGPDARAVPNSVKKWIDQNTYGHVSLAGQVYPDWVRVNTLAHYNQMDYEAPGQIVLDAIGQIKTLTPTFLDDHTFDFIVLLLPGDLGACYYPYEQTSVLWNDPNGHFKGYLLIDIPVGTNSTYRFPINNEPAQSLDSRHVQTRCNPDLVRGVWLASDSAHLGANYYTGGSFRHWENTLTLGTPLPAGNTPVLISYSPKCFYAVQDPAAPHFGAAYSGVWYGAFLHELMHGIGPHISFSETRSIGDLYQAPAELILDYGLMSSGNHNTAASGPDVYNEPCHFDAYTKYVLGFLPPYELRFGESERKLRLFATEEYPCTSRAKLIKIPVKPPGKFSFLRLGNVDYWGDEYLLLELRRKGDVPGIHNFDRGLPHEGLLIYHVLEGYPNNHGAQAYNFVRLIDATPGMTNVATLDPVLLEQVSIMSDTSPAPFGPASQVFEWTYSAPRQSVAADKSTFKFLLPRRDTARVYAKFIDPTGKEIGTSSCVVEFAWADDNHNQIPDDWEKRYFGSTTSLTADSDSDADRDGISNLDEYLAGTDPTNPASCLRLKVTPVGQQLRIQYPVIPGRSYLLEYSLDLTRNRWYRPYPGYDIPSPTGTNTYYELNTPSAPQRFYRLRLLP